jgi:hypothetical protein
VEDVDPVVVVEESFAAKKSDVGVEESDMETLMLKLVSNLAVKAPKMYQ